MQIVFLSHGLATSLGERKLWIQTNCTLTKNSSHVTSFPRWKVVYYIDLCLPPGRIWYKIFFCSGDFVKGEVVQEPRLMCGKSVLVIGLVSANWTIVIVKSPCTKPGDLTGRRFTRPDVNLCLSLIPPF